MFSRNARPNTDQDVFGQEESFDLEALSTAETGLRSPNDDDSSPTPPKQLIKSTWIHKILCYPPRGSLGIKSTSWLDGVRGAAALGVYIFHTMALWVSVAPAWNSANSEKNFVQWPFLRTFFVSGGSAVCVFFVLSGYVLTFKSLRWLREGLPAKLQVNPAVASSLFRRGFRLYIPPILLTFVEMLATRFGITPPLNFFFLPEPTFFAQFVDWVKAVNRFVNPLYNFTGAMQGQAIGIRYDPVVWTLPLEFYGSLVCYVFLFIFVWIQSNQLRMSLLVVFSLACLLAGSWNLFCFLAGMLLADFNLGQGEQDAEPPMNYGVLWTALFAIAFYMAGFPSLGSPIARQQPMPGFETLHSLTPTFIHMEDHSRFWWSISGVAMLLSISQLPQLKKLFETNLCQYLGKIAFSLYLIHELSLVLFGLALQTFLLRLAGLEQNAGTLGYWFLCVVWYVLFSVPAFAFAAQVERWVDTPSVKFSKWLEVKCLKLYQRLRGKI